MRRVFSTRHRCLTEKKSYLSPDSTSLLDEEIADKRQFTPPMRGDTQAYEGMPTVYFHGFLTGPAPTLQHAAEILERIERDIQGEGVHTYEEETDIYRAQIRAENTSIDAELYDDGFEPRLGLSIEAWFSHRATSRALGCVWSHLECISLLTETHELFDPEKQQLYMFIQRKGTITIPEPGKRIILPGANIILPRKQLYDHGTSTVRSANPHVSP